MYTYICFFPRLFVTDVAASSVEFPDWAQWPPKSGPMWVPKVRDIIEQHL